MQAVDVLVKGTGDTQPEVLRDLRSSPPDLRDADQRLQALYDALQSRVDTPDPGQASQQLHSILSQPRYAGLSAGPSLPSFLTAGSHVHKGNHLARGGVALVLGVACLIGAWFSSKTKSSS